MSAMMILKIFSDCCICFAILASGPIRFDLPLLLPACVCGIGAGIATFFDRKELPVLRWLSAAIPLCSLLLAGSREQALILALPAIYTAGVILRGKLELEYSGFRHFFIRSLGLLAVVYWVALVWDFLAQITGTAALRLDAGMILRYGLVHLLCGVVLQRQLRLGVGYRAAGGRRQMATLLGTTTTMVVGFLAAEPLMRRGAGVLIRQLLMALLTPIAYVVDLVWRFLVSLFHRDGDEKTYQEFVDHMESIMMGDLQNGPQTSQPPAEFGLNATALWAILVGALLLVAVILLLRSFFKRSAELDGGEQTVRVITAPKKKKAPAFSNRTRVRQIYRDFLRVEKNLGMGLKHSDTSLDVLQRIHPQTDRTGAGDLRQVYLAARYDDRDNITRSQVEQAKQAIKAAHRSKNG